MTKNKRVLSFILVMLMVISLLPTFALADSDSSSTEQPVWPEEGSIKLEKDAQAVAGEDNLWEVTLGIQGKNYKTTSDVVLVIDNSNSMYTQKESGGDYYYEEDDSCRMHMTKIAAKAFAEKLLTEGSTTRIALVVYGTDLRSFTPFYGAEQKATLISSINAIQPESDVNNGGTNQQAGIHKAQALLASSASTGKLKNIVILSDGEATYCYKVAALNDNIEFGYEVHVESNCSYYNRKQHKTPTVELQATEPKSNVTIKSCNYDKVIGSGSDFNLNNDYYTQSYQLPINGYFNHPARTGAFTCDHLIPSNDKTWHYTIDANNSNGASNSTVHFTGYSVDTKTFSTKVASNMKVTNCGQSTIWEANTAKAAGTTIFSVALQAGSNGEATLKSCATDPTKGYFAIGSKDNVETKLTDAFTAIAGSIAIAAKNGVVNDTMGDKVQLSFSSTAPVITNNKAVYDAGNADVYISQGTATYDAATRSINWTVGNVSEGDNPTMKYKVKVKEGYNPPTGEVLDANKEATFSYTNYLGHETKSTFPVPKVTVGGGTILVHYYLVNGNGQPINENGTVVDSPSLAKQVKPAEYFSVGGETGLGYNTPYSVSKQDINGYTYFGKYNLNNGALIEGDVASVTLTAANSNQHVWFAYTQSFTVAHVQNGVVAATDTFPVQQDFNLTEHVSDGYLYGGAFTNDACDADHVQNFTAGENALDFTPEAGETYYIWEVDQKYLAPKTFCTWYTNADSKREVTGLYLMTPLDRTLYREAGFTIGADSFKSEKDGELLAYGDITVKYGRNPGRTDLLYLSNGLMQQDVNYDGEHTSHNKDSGYIAVYPLTPEQFKDFTTNPFTFQPYWITLDGVKVTGTTSRTCTYKAPPTTTIGVESNPGSSQVSAVPDSTVQAAPMMVAATYTLVADQGPTAQDTVTITVNDNGNTYDITANRGDNKAGQIPYTAVDGKVFAGWYADEACTTPADLTNVQADMTIYAKYVSDSYLRVKYTQTGLFRARSVSLVAAVDAGTDYTDSGFIINGKEVSATDYSTRYGLLRAQTLFGRGVDKNALLMTTRYPLSGMSYGDTLEIKPYWVTPDGTTVTGETRTLTYGRFGLKG